MPSTLLTTARRVVAARKNDAVLGEAFRVQGYAPIGVVLQNQDAVECVLGAYKISSAGVAGRATLADVDTQRTAEATGYTGNSVTLSFSGQDLNNLPIVPKSVTVYAAVSALTLEDGGDGILYTVDADRNAAGTINYFTGALVLTYPTGKAPNGALSANYKSSDATLKASARKAYSFSSLAPGEVLVLGLACKAPALSSLVFVEASVSGGATFIGG